MVTAQQGDQINGGCYAYAKHRGAERPPLGTVKEINVRFAHVTSLWRFGPLLALKRHPAGGERPRLATKPVCLRVVDSKRSERILLAHRKAKSRGKSPDSWRVDIAVLNNDAG